MARPPVKAQELAEELSAQIRAGELAAGTYLPSERQLAETHGVARSTARQAAHILDELGLVEVVPGSGARIARAPLEATDLRAEVAHLRGEVADLRRQVAEMQKRLILIETSVAPSVSDM